MSVEELVKRLRAFQIYQSTTGRVGHLPLSIEAAEQAEPAPAARSGAVKVEAIVDAIFADLRDRRFLRWLFSERPTFIGRLDGDDLHSFDEEVQQEIRDAWGKIILAAPEPDEPATDVHPDDIAVDRFAAAMKAKLAKKRADGRTGWQDCSEGYLSALLLDHVSKGDPLDVANLSMMLHHNGQRICAGPAADAEPEELRKWRDDELERVRDGSFITRPSESRLREAAEKLVPYLKWTIGPESPGCHPTMPSAVSALLDALAQGADDGRA